MAYPFDAEPDVPHSLLALENVVLFLHMGSGTFETRQAMGELAWDKLQGWLPNDRAVVRPAV